MEEWRGAAGVCINEKSELLMVLQGAPDERRTWSIPSGGKERNETFEDCCIREIEEETGYKTEIIKKMKVKKRKYEAYNISAEVHYFLVKIIGGTRSIQDPDQLIHGIAWKNVQEIKELELSFPEDREFLIECLMK
ncbi:MULTISPECIES: NUDIX hydrolase [unclassified Oceanobacillus]|uniref:NUDIX hydrolase n=1 Tax=unclassified Oceanobacillus TaxID=2630292 RepID=UPI00300DE32A